MIDQLFSVATEFRFDVGEALLNTRALTGAVNDLSTASNSALGSLSYLGSGLVAHLGLGSGGIFGFLKKSVEASEDLNSAALNFSNTISANLPVLSGHVNNFNERLETSKMLLGKISDTANRFAIPANDLARMTEILAPGLAHHNKLMEGPAPFVPGQITPPTQTFSMPGMGQPGMPALGQLKVHEVILPHGGKEGALGNNFEGAIEMAKNLSLAAEQLQIPLQMATESLAASLNDRQPVHGKLFNRMVNTIPFQQAGIKTQAQLAIMDPSKKIFLVDKALKSLTSDSDALNYRLNSLHGQFTILRNIFTQVGSILAPLGDALKKPIIKMLMFVTSYVQTNGKELGNSLARLVDSMMDSPKAMYINLMQLKHLGKDFKTAIDVSSFALMAGGLMKMIGPLKGAGMALERFLGVTTGLGFIEILTSKAGFLWKGVLLLTSAFADFIPITAALTFAFQVLSRAKAIARVQDFEYLLGMFPNLVNMFVQFKQSLSNILFPITMAIDGLAQLLASTYMWSMYLQLLMPIINLTADAFKILGDGMVGMLAIISGLSMAIIGFVDDLAHLKNPLGNVKDNFKMGLDDFLAKNAARMGDLSKATVNQVNNINGNITIRNDFKENQEPDRIAYTIKEQILKAGRNKTQGARTGLTKAFASP